MKHLRTIWLISKLWMAISTIALLALLATLRGAAQAAPDYQVISALEIQIVYGSLIRDGAGNLYGTTLSGGIHGSGTVFKIAEDGSGFAILHSFDRTADGAMPVAGLTLGSDGMLYGTTSEGGTFGNGTVFKIYPSGAGFTVLHHFDATKADDGANPWAALVQASDGDLYGTTRDGGEKGDGTVFKIATNGLGFGVLHSFDSNKSDDGANPQAWLIQGADSELYGTTTEGGANNGAGTVFKITTDGLSFTVLHSFDGSKTDDGAAPQAGLTLGGSYFYGTTVVGGSEGTGTVFKIDSSGAGFAVLHSFNGTTEGASPLAGLTMGGDGKLYGTAVNAGVNNRGTIYSIDPSGPVFTVLHPFDGVDSEYPYAGLTLGADGNFYGATVYGGTVFGTLYKIAPNGSGFAVLHTFEGIKGASFAAALTLGSDGNFYGASLNGGLSGDYGTVYRLDPTGSMFTILHSFDFTDGVSPLAELIQGSDGKLYGTASGGGIPAPGPGYGTVYSIDPSGTDFAVLHSFADLVNGGNPVTGLTERSDGSLYGTTANGNGTTSGSGTLYKITKDKTFSVVHTFMGGADDGATPYAGLILGKDGNFYSTTYGGGANGVGAVYKIDPDGMGFSVIHSFDTTHGKHPTTPLIVGSDDALYGTTYEGGDGPGNGYGTVYRIDPSAPPESNFSVLHYFDSAHGANPRAGLRLGKDGNLYGTTYAGGSSDRGTAYMLDSSGVVFEVLHSFDLADGVNPIAGLTLGSDGNFYGATTAVSVSGTGYPGLLYRVCLATCATTTLTSNRNPSTFGAPVTFTATVTGNSPTGAVTFKDGATEIGTGTLSGGAATSMTSSLSVGVHSITASYSGDSNNSAGTSTVLSQVVNEVPPTKTTLESSLNPSTFGTLVTFTATVTGDSPSGKVTFKDGASEIGSGDLNGSGQATFEISKLSVATHSITAHYGGDANNGPSDSSVLSQVVNRAFTTTTLESSLNPSMFGASVTFTATVTGKDPSGMVIFKDSGAEIGTGDLNGSGHATFTTDSLSIGIHSITADYGGDTNNASSPSDVLSQMVNGMAATTTTLESSLNPSTFGALVTFTAMVTGSSPTGTVIFRDGTTELGFGTVSGGEATYMTNNLSVGTHSITAHYGGDSNNTPSSSTVLKQEVLVSMTTTTVTSSLNPSTFGSSVTFTATVAGNNPKGTVTFKDGAAMLGSATVKKGKASFTTASLIVGTHGITASYGGDANNGPSSSTVLNQEVNKAVTTTKVKSKPNPSTFGSSVTFTATVTGRNPTGTVTFKDGATGIGSVMLNKGQATFATNSLSIGTHSITANYEGDTNNAPSISPVLMETVKVNQRPALALLSGAEPLMTRRLRRH